MVIFDVANIWKMEEAIRGSIALGYISDVVFFVHCFIVELLQMSCGDGRVKIGF